MSILRNGYMAEVLAELKRDAGKLWVEPNFIATQDCYGWQAADFKVRFYDAGLARIMPLYDNRPFLHEPYTPARFRAALKKLKTKGRK